jgi:cytochrome c oxidase subunit IV
MLAITVVELIIGAMAPGKGWTGATWLKVFFIVLTIAKAAAIVWWFMHLGHEVKFFQYVVLIPYIIFMAYTIFIVLTEGTYAGGAGRYAKIDPILVEQQKKLASGHHGGGHDSHESKSESHTEEGHH